MRWLGWCVENKTDLADNCLPMTYLGMLLGASFNSKSIWNPILEKLDIIEEYIIELYYLLFILFHYHYPY